MLVWNQKNCKYFGRYTNMEKEIKVRGRTVIYRIVPKKGWAVVVKEDNVLIDNYHHGYPHIHPDREPIKYDDVYVVVDIVVKHIEGYTW